MTKSIKAFLFIVLGCCIFNVLSGIFVPKNWGGMLRNLYSERRDGIDVVFLGNSHVYCGIEPATLWLEEGIPGLVLASSTQHPYMTYFRLLEVIETQTPKLLVIDLNCFVRSPRGSITHISGMNGMFDWNLFSPHILDVLDETLKRLGREEEWTLYLDFLLELPMVHSRYTNLAALDFFNPSEDVLYKKGFLPRDTVRPIKSFAMTPESEKDNLIPENMAYLHLIIELAQRKDLKLLFIIAPHQRSYSEIQRKYNYIKPILLEQGYDVIDFLARLEEVGFDLRSDFYDTEHLNIKGAIRLTSYLAKRIKSDYLLPDRRNNVNYQEWDSWAKRASRILKSKYNRKNPENTMK